MYIIQNLTCPPNFAKNKNKKIVFFYNGVSTVKFLTLKTLSVEISVKKNRFAIAIEQGGGV